MVKLFKNNKVLCVIVGIVSLVAVLLFAGAESNRRWQGDQYFGVITRMTDGGFVMFDKRSGERIVEIGAETVVKWGTRAQANGLNITDQVIVVGREDADGHVRAALVRILEERR